MAYVSALWRSPAPGSGRVDPVERARALADHGLEGCAHAKPGEAGQVLLVSAEHLRALGLEPGTLRENVTVEGMDVQAWPIGQRLAVGDAVFEVTVEGHGCERMEAIRPGLREELRERRGMLARVVEGGELAVGDEIRLL